MRRRYCALAPYAALRRWRERQQLKTDQGGERAPLPEPVTDAMREAVERLWKAAQDETQREIDRLTQAMNDRVAAAQVERDAALAELQATAEDLQAAKARCDALEAELQGARQEVGTLQGGIASAAREVEIATSRAVEIERRADDLGKELARVHDEALAERQRLAVESAARASQFETERERARQEVAEARESAARLQGQIQAMESQLAELMRAIRPNPPPKKGG